MMPEETPDSLLKEVPGHLFQFEEKIWGMTLQQLLSDLGALVGSIALTGAVQLPLRLLLCTLVTLLVMLLVMLLVHAKVQGMPLGTWCGLLVRFALLPAVTTWQSPSAPPAQQTQHASNQPPSVQETWVALDSIQHGVMSTRDRRRALSIARAWMVFEIEGRNLHLLPEHEQLRAYRRFEAFVTGLAFHVQWVSLTEQLDAARSPALLAQQQVLPSLAPTPHLRALQQASVRVQQQQMTTCTRTRHFLIVSVSGTEAVFHERNGTPHALVASLGHLLSLRKQTAVTREQVLNQLAVRAAAVKKALGQLDMRIWPLDDNEALQLFAHCLAPGSTGPSVLPQALRPCVDGVAQRQHRQPGQARTQTEHLHAADLIAPSRVQVHPDLLEIQVGAHTRYVRTFMVTGYGHHLSCGWLRSIIGAGLPMMVSSHCEPLDSRFMVMKLEHHLTRLESQRLSDAKTLRLTKVDQSLEAEQVRRVSRALASRQCSIFAVSLTLCLHAGSRERLEQRTRYLLSLLRDQQIQARPATRQHDLAWQSCLPTGLDLLQQWAKLPSDVLSTFLPASSEVTGTPTGVLLGHTEHGVSQRPVYFHPWSPEKKVANPHIVVVGESGMGKSWLGKTIVTGLLGLALADVVVLDHDDDYQPLHEALHGESQRYVLARRCPLNLFAIPLAPCDVDPDDPTDLLAEFFDNALLTGLSLVVNDEQSRLSKQEEAYLLHVARATYATQGISSEAIRRQPDTLLLPAPTFADFLATMHTMPASSEALRQSLLERLEKASYLFEAGQSSVSLDKPLTIFSIAGMDEKWYALMTYVVQNFLLRHRALKRDERYLAYVVEEASYLLKHPAGRRYLETGARGFRKLGIAQITLSQHPRDFLEAGQVILSNAGTAFFLGMQRPAAEKLTLPEALERSLIDSMPGECIMRLGNEYTPLKVWSNPVYRTLFTTDPAERRAMRQAASSTSASVKGRK